MNIKHGFDLAEEILTLSIKDQKTMFKTLEADIAADFLPYIEASKRVSVFMRFSAKKHLLILSEMASDDALDLIRLLPKHYANKLIESSEDKEDYEWVLSFEEDMIGAYVTLDYISVIDHMTAKEATKIVIEAAPDVEVLSEILVINHEEQLIGSISLKTLLRLTASEPIKPHIETISSIEGTKTIIESMTLLEISKQKYLPVTDDSILLGIITLDDAIDLYQESAIEEVKKFSGLPVESHETDKKNGLKRLPWLMTLLIFFIPTFVLIQSFEVVIAQFVILMFFQPLILGSAGNVATQTLGITLQSLSKQELSISKTFFKEMAASLLIAFTMALIAFGMTYLYARVLSMDNIIYFALTISLSLFLTLLVAPFISIVVPLTLKALKQDPAIASGPFITTLNDLTSLFIYFSIATLLLGGLYR